MNVESEDIIDITPSVSIAGSIVLLCATTLGAGILAIPNTVALVGFGMGLAALVFFGICSIYSIYMLLVAGDRMKLKSYEEVVEAAFPKVGRILTTIFMNLLLFGALTGFMVIIADQVNDVVIFASGGHVAFYTDKNFLLALVAVFIIFPLSMLKNISKLEYSSFAAVAIIFFFTIIVIIVVSKRLAYNLVDWSQIKGFDLSAKGIFKATPIMSLAYTCQGSIFPIWLELSDRSLYRMNIVQICANIFSGILYCIVGFFGYLFFPTDTPSNILNGLPDEIFYIIVRSAFAVAIIFHYPVVHFGFRTSLEVTVFHKYDFSWIRHTIETALVVIASTGLAIVLPDLTKVFDLTGAVAAYPIAYMFPAICYVKILFYDNLIKVESTIQRNGGENGELKYLVPGKKEKSLWNLLDVRVVPPLFLFLLSLMSSIVSLYITITDEFIGAG